MKILVRVDGDDAMSCSSPGQSEGVRYRHHTMIAWGHFPLTARMADKRMASFGAKQAQHRFGDLRVLWQRCSSQRELSITLAEISASIRSTKAAQSVDVAWSVCCSRAASSQSMWRAARSPIVSTWSSRTSSRASFSASSSATPRRQANEKVAPRPDAAQPSPSLALPQW